MWFTKNQAITPDDKKTSWFWNGSLLFNLQYFGQIFIKSWSQGWFWNPQELISKLSLLTRFDQELAEILRVKKMASISKSIGFFVVGCRNMNLCTLKNSFLDAIASLAVGHDCQSVTKSQTICEIWENKW